ncbi:MAG: PEP-CTERM sorting domain-containing protein [Caldimonas sp.]|nr:PEP-CTERM sorting domain-containing protein [Pseudomonadota bacterium]
MLGLALCGSASALAVVTGSFSRSGLGAEFVTPYDSFAIDGTTQTLATPWTPVDVAIGDYSFEVGPNCSACTQTPSFDALLDVSVDGQTLQLDVPFAWSSNGPTDSLSFSSAAPLLFDLGAAGSLRFALDDIGVLSSDVGVVRGQLYANLAVTPVPEPSSAALLFAGLGAVVFVVRRKGRARR